MHSLIQASLQLQRLNKISMGSASRSASGAAFVDVLSLLRSQLHARAQCTFCFTQMSVVVIAQRPKQSIRLIVGRLQCDG